MKTESRELKDRDRDTYTDTDRQRPRQVQRHTCRYLCAHPHVKYDSRFLAVTDSKHSEELVKFIFLLNFYPSLNKIPSGALVQCHTPEAPLGAPNIKVILLANSIGDPCLFTS